MFRAVWQIGRDVSKKEVVAEIATELGLPESEEVPRVGLLAVGVTAR